MPATGFVTRFLLSVPKGSFKDLFETEPHTDFCDTYSKVFSVLH